jgi:hypothetical protein
MARLNPLESNGYKLMLWGHEASTYLCVGSLGFQGSSKINKITINANVRQQLFNQEALMKNTYKIMKITLIHTLVVNLPIAYSTTLPRNNSSKRLRYTPRDKKQDKS